MRPIITAVGPLAAGSANSIATSQTPSGGTFTINGSTAKTSPSGTVYAQLDNPRRVLITTADTTHTYTVTGTNSAGAQVSEVVGPITTSATTAQNFYTVTSIVANGTPTAATTVGATSTSGATTDWVRTDEWANPQVSVQCNVSGTVSYTVQASNDDPNDPTNPVAPQNMTWIATNDSQGVNATGSILTNYFFSPRYVRAVLNSGTGTVTMTVTQYEAAPR